MLTMIKSLLDDESKVAPVPQMTYLHLVVMDKMKPERAYHYYTKDNCPVKSCSGYSTIS